MFTSGRDALRLVRFRPGFCLAVAGITALSDNNYVLFECDGYGLLCHQVYRSGDCALAEPRRPDP